jgi:dolichol-phosphate mannosyltransferase
MGIGAAIRTGIYHAKENKYDFVIISSSNGKIRPEDLNTVVEPILKGTADYTTGSRFIAGGSSPGLTPFRRLAIPVFSTLTSLLLLRRFTDITCGYRAYKLSLFDDPIVNIQQDWLNRYEMEYYIHYWAVKNKIRIKEVPVTIEYTHLEKGRKSKIKPFSGWWQMIRPILFLRMGIKT